MRYTQDNCTYEPKIITIETHEYAKEYCIDIANDPV